jgi:tight adherence protein B
MSPAIIAIGVFVGVILVIYVISVVTSGGQRMDQRIAQVIEGEPEIDAAAIEEITGRPAQRQEERLPGLARLLAGRGIAASLERRLTSSGVPLRPTEFVAIWAVSAIGMLIIGLLASRGSIFVTGMLVLIGLLVPHMLLNFLYNRRRLTLEAQLADALTMIASGLKAGYTVLQGMQASADQLPDPISTEFGRVARLVNLGMDLGNALRRMGERAQSYDFDIVITAINIQLTTGGNLANLLETIAGTIRERITLRREINAATSQGKLSGLVLILLPIGIGCGLMIINREYASYLFTTTLGKNLLKVAAFQQFIGIWIIKRLLNFEA